ncbi:DUF922 domain-containing Zn-dependent protease [Jiella sp. M17.18]|uniref:DUF922 domain-containing Zn-dependent protease n=1 Tax=Jiella sp. M17.18 TaxID=3234247 RepID=UPI0034DF755D
MLGLLPLALAAALAGLGAGTADAASIKEQTTYFAVHGTTLQDLDRDLSRRGPFLADTGLHHPGATEISFGGKITYKHVPEGCAVNRVGITLGLKTTLPKWTPPAGASARTRLIWNTLAADIVRHEGRHSAIAKQWATRMEMAIRNLAPRSSCAAMEAAVGRVTSRYLAWHADAQVQFDEIEGREVSMRLRRALNRAAEEQAAR